MRSDAVAQGSSRVFVAPSVGVMAESRVSTPSHVEVSVVLLEDALMAEAGPTASMPSITDDVLAFLAEADPEAEAEAAGAGAGTPSELERGRVVDTLLVGVEELLALGDVASARELLRQAEQRDPQDGRLERARTRCLEARLGNTRQVPLLKLRMAELMKLSLDARMGFLLSRIDGRTSYEELFSVSGMSRADTLRVLVQLLDRDIILPRGR